MNIHIKKQKQSSDKRNLAKEIYRSKKMNEKYDIDYFSSDTHIIIKKKEGLEMNFTELEMKVMVAMTKDDFAREGYLNTYSDDYFSCWTDCVIDTIQQETKLSPRQIAGVFSSLSKKGVIFSNNEITNVFIRKLPSKIKKMYPKRGN